MTHRLDEAIRHLEGCVSARFPLRAQYGGVDFGEWDGPHGSSVAVHDAPLRNRLRSYIAALRVLRREREICDHCNCRGGHAFDCPRLHADAL